MSATWGPVVAGLGDVAHSTLVICERQRTQGHRTLPVRGGDVEPRYGRAVEYTDLIADFAQRTLRNLDHLELLARAGEDVYPVTQLWNSLLGLIVLPREREFERIPRTPMTQLWSEGWPHITVAGPELRSLPDLVRALRNAVAHFNVEFIADTDREIASVKVWNQGVGRGSTAVRDSRGWQGQINVDELDRLARLIAGVYLKEFASSSA